MSSYQLFLILLGIFLIELVAIGVYFTGRQQSVTDFWLAGRRVGTMNTGFSAAASWLTAGAMLAVIGFFMLNGMGSIWGFVAPNILALLIIALFVKRIKKLPSITQPELLEQRYSGAIRAPVAIIITIVMVLFAVADIKGFAFLLQVYYGLSPIYAAGIVALAVSVYVTLGGFSAVVWTDLVQYVFLALFAVIMAVVTVNAATAPESGREILTAGQLFGQVPASWWNPLSIGLPMVLIFCLSILPGWISEQDPWQRIWAAKDARSARRGMLLGAFLILIVFSACAVIAISLNRLHPEIAALGFPAGMSRAEPALLNFIISRDFSPLVVALTAIGLAAAAMSCADTFATSGASCLSRDIYQRYIKPDATMQEMLRVNRISVLIIVLAATLASFVIDSIIDAIHIATFIASASYFFPLMGGLYWKRATKQGAVAGLVAGAIAQIVLVAVDLVKTPPASPPFLETLNPILTGHGVILGMGLSAVMFIGVSLASRPSSTVRLAPFFAEEARKLAAGDSDSLDENSEQYHQFLEQLRVNPAGDRTQLHLNLTAPAPLQWHLLTTRLQGDHSPWVMPTGRDAVYRMTHPDMLACVSIIRGRTDNEIWFKAEPSNGLAARQKKELFNAYSEVAAVLSLSELSQN